MVAAVLSQVFNLSKGFCTYELTAPKSVDKPTLAHYLTTLDETYARSNWFMSFTERSGFASRGSLLDLWSEQVPPSLALYLGHRSTCNLLSTYTKRTEPFVCVVIEAHEHTLQLLFTTSRNTQLPRYLSSFPI